MSKRDINMTDGPIFVRMLLYTLPLMLSGLLQLLYNSADVLVVGRYAADTKISLAAVGSTGSITSLIIGLTMGLSVGACVVASQYLGMKSDRDTSEVVHTSMLTGAILGIIIGVFGCVFARPLLVLMKSPPNVIDKATLYMTIYFIGIPASMIYNYGAAILRAKGDTNFALITLIISGAVNVAFNLVSVIVWKWDVAGVAIGTVCSQVISAVMIVVHLCRMRDSCRLEFKKLRFHKDKLKKIIRIGIPAGIQSSLFSASNVIIQSSINSLGSAAMAGNTASANIDQYIYTAQTAVHNATMAFTGQNIGARKPERLGRITAVSLIMVLSIGLVLGTLVFTFKRPLLEIFAPGQDDVIAQGIERVNIIAITQSLCGIMEIFTGALRGMGCSFTPMVISLVGACGLRIVWLYGFFPLEQFHNMTGIFISYPLSWIATILGQIIAYTVVKRKTVKRLTAEPLPDKAIT